MKNILLILLFAAVLILSSCSKSGDPQPTCEEDGTEVTPQLKQKGIFYIINIPFKKGTSGNYIGRPKGSVSPTSKLIREHISQAIDGNKIKQMLDKIESPTEQVYIKE